MTTYEVDRFHRIIPDPGDDPRIKCVGETNSLQMYSGFCPATMTFTLKKNLKYEFSCAANAKAFLIQHGGEVTAGAIEER